MSDAEPRHGVDGWVLADYKWCGEYASFVYTRQGSKSQTVQRPSKWYTPPEPWDRADLA